MDSYSLDCSQGHDSILSIPLVADLIPGDIAREVLEQLGEEGHLHELVERN